MRRASLGFGTGAPNGFDEPSTLCSVSRRQYKGGPGGGQIPERLPVDAGGNRRAHPLRRVGGSLPANLRQQTGSRPRAFGASGLEIQGLPTGDHACSAVPLDRLNRWPPTQSRCWRSHSDSAQLPPQPSAQASYARGDELVGLAAGCAGRQFPVQPAFAPDATSGLFVGPAGGPAHVRVLELLDARPVRVGPRSGSPGSVAAT